MTTDLKKETQTTVAYKKYLTTREAADYIGTTLGNLYQLMHDKKIGYFSPTGRKALFKTEELDAWVERARISTKEEIEYIVQNRKGGAA